MKLATLCYLRDENRTLMLYRNKKQGDVHIGKYNGLGGKLEQGETPEECAIREVREESGLKAKKPLLKGVLTFPGFSNGEDWYVFVFLIKDFEGSVADCTEGSLEWVENDKIMQLPLWEGDRIFLPWLEQKRFFSGKFCYLNGKLKNWQVSFHE